MDSAQNPGPQRRQIGIFGDTDGELAAALAGMGFSVRPRSAADSDEEAVTSQHEDDQPLPVSDQTDPKHFV